MWEVGWELFIIIMSGYIGMAIFSSMMQGIKSLSWIIPKDNHELRKYLWVEKIVDMLDNCVK